MSLNMIGTMGVMVCRRPGFPPFAEREYLGKLSSQAKGLGMQVFVFCPDDNSVAGGTGGSVNQIQGYRYNLADGWSIGTFSAPELIYDRCMYQNGDEIAGVSKFLNRLLQSGSMLWSRGLPGKLKVHQFLKRSSALKRHLPATIQYTGAESLNRTLQIFESGIFMKPSGGSHGRHTLYLSFIEDQKIKLQGRDRRNHTFEQTIALQQMDDWVRHFTGNRRFIIQPFLKLLNRKGNPYDLRSLVQKNDRGLWSITGIAVRQGAEDGLTSNLHGGGTAYPALPYLASDFGDEKAGQIIRTIRHLSVQLPPLLEEGFGRLGELGIDFGVDTQGQLWILEVNSKPGRRAFTLTGDARAARLSVEHPIQYARYLLLRQLRRVNT